MAQTVAVILFTHQILSAHLSRHNKIWVQKFSVARWLNG